jgi:hypothetical protein
MRPPRPAAATGMNRFAGPAAPQTGADDLPHPVGRRRVADQPGRRVAAQAARLPHREKRDGGEWHAQQQAAERKADDGRPRHRQHHAERLQRIGAQPAAAGCPNGSARGHRSSAPGMMASPNSGQKKSGQGEPGSACRAITGRKVAVMIAAAIDRAAVLHHQHLVRHGADHVDVVRDQQVAQARSRCSRCSRPSTCFLDGDVQRAGGLVQHQQLGLTISAGRSPGAGAGRRRTRADSAAAARKLRLGQADVASACSEARSRRPEAAGRARARAGLAHDLLDRHARRQRGERVLEHHLHQPAHGPVGRGLRAPALPATSAAPWCGSRPSAASARVDLPEPDSPTTPSVPPAAPGNSRPSPPRIRPCGTSRGCREWAPDRPRAAAGRASPAAGIRRAGLVQPVALRPAVDQLAGVGMLRPLRTPRPPGPAPRGGRFPSPPPGRRTCAPGSGRA